jgi:hypothetical protein
LEKLRGKESFAKIFSFNFPNSDHIPSKREIGIILQPASDLEYVFILFFFIIIPLVTVNE